MLAALPSWRAEISSTPAPTSACEILKLAVPSRPKHRRAPNAARSLAMAAATVVLPFMAPSIEAPDARAGDVPANSDNRLLDALQYAHIIGDGGAAHVVNPAEPRVRQLHAARRAAELHRGERVHRHAGGPDRVAFGLQAAGRIDRKRAVLLR